MSDRNTVARILLVLYALDSVAIALPLLFAFDHAADLADTTSGKILAAALSSRWASARWPRPATPGAIDS